MLRKDMKKTPKTKRDAKTNEKKLASISVISYQLNDC